MSSTGFVLIRDIISITTLLSSIFISETLMSWTFWALWPPEISATNITKFRINFLMSNAWISCILQKELKSKETFHVNWAFFNVRLFSNIPVIYFLTIGILPKLDLCCWLIPDDNALPAIKICLKEFRCLTNDVRKANGTWTGGSTG